MRHWNKHLFSRAWSWVTSPFEGKQLRYGVYAHSNIHKYKYDSFKVLWWDKTDPLRTILVQHNQQFPLQASTLCAWLSYNTACIATPWNNFLHSFPVIYIFTLFLSLYDLPILFMLSLFLTPVSQSNAMLVYFQFKQSIIQSYIHFPTTFLPSTLYYVSHVVVHSNLPIKWKKKTPLQNVRSKGTARK